MPLPRKPRPTIRGIAQIACVSPTAVSRALRGDPGISAATRQRVARIAAEIGYCPDPQVTRLMGYLAQRRRPAFRSVLYALTTLAGHATTPYVHAILSGAAERAEALGYGFKVVVVTGDAGHRAGLERMLRNRGVEGLLLAPMRSPIAIDHLLDWKRFHVINTTCGVLSPVFEGVMPHQFANVRQIHRELSALGYRRIGLIVSTEHDRRVDHGFSAAAAVHRMAIPSAPSPLLHPEGDLSDIGDWFRREQPDAIIASGEEDCKRIASLLHLDIPGPVGFAATSCVAGSLFAGIDERPREIGAKAVDLLNINLRIGRTEVKEANTTTLVRGRWRPGFSAGPVA